MMVSSSKHFSNFFLRKINFLVAGGYKNGVGGRVAESIGLYVSVSNVGSSWNRSLAI